MRTTLEALLHAARTRPYQIAFIADGRIWSFRRFVEEIERTVQAFVAHGVRPGDRVALHMANIPEIAIAYFACFRLGAIAAPLNNRFKTQELQALLERLQCTLYIGQNHLYPLAAPVECRILPMEARFVIGRPAVNDGARPWDALFDHGEVALPAPPPVDATVLLQTTSGTTGQPKFVAHSPATIAASGEGLLSFGLVPGDIIINCCPMVHSTGLVMLIASIHHRAPMVLLERFDPDAVLDAIEMYRGTWILGMPFMYAALLERQRAQRRDLSSLRFCVSGGDVCPATLQQEFPYAFGRPLRTVWGMTETSGNLAYGERPGPALRIADGAEIRLVDDNDDAVPRGMPGELLVRGRDVALGYWQEPGRIDPCGPGGWLATGDIMRQGVGDELWFVSRKKDLVIRGGSNIAPAEVEQVLKSHPFVRDAAAFGIPDPVLGQRVAAVIELVEDAGDAALDDIMAKVRPQLADYKLPERLQVVRQIPRNALGKIERAFLPTLLAPSQRSGGGNDT